MATITEDYVSYEVAKLLKESEDERVRKEILDFCKNKAEKYPNDPKYKNISAWIAWLEKQGDKVSAIEGFETEFERQVSHLIASAINREHEYNEGYVKWTANALLNFAKHEFERQGEQKDILEDVTLDSNDDGLIAETIGVKQRGQKLEDKSALEAVKEEKVDNQNCVKPTDKVEPKFKVGDKVKKGYLTYTVEDIDEDSYKLQAYSKSGDKGSTVFLTIGYEKDYELVEQKPAEWSEEDEQWWKVIAQTELTEAAKDWIRTLIDRATLQPKQEWSEEEIENCAREAEDNNCIILAKHIRQLKSLRPQNWTKEDKERYISCLQRLSTGNPEQPETINSKWFKEHVYPQSHWKPSDEMLEALYRVIPENVMEKSEDEMLLDKLYQGLKYGRVLNEN